MHNHPMALEKASCYIPAALARILGIMVSKTPEKDIVKDYDIYYKEGMKNLNSELRDGLQQYLAKSKNSKLEKIAVLMQEQGLLN